MNINIPDRKTLIAFLSVVFLGGLNSVAVRFSNQELPPFYGATLRLSFAALIFWVLFLFQRKSLPAKRDVLILLVNGFLSTGLGFAFLYWGLLEISASLGSVILATAPLLTFAFAFLHRLEPFRWQVLVGGLISIIGMGIALNAQMDVNIPILSVLALVVGSAVGAEGNVILKIFSPKSDPVTLNALMLSSGGLFLAIASIFTGETWSVPSSSSTWLALMYLIVGGSVLMFYLFVYVLINWSVSVASYTILLFPIVATIFGAILAGEGIDLLFIVGGLVVILGVWFGAFFHSKP